MIGASAATTDIYWFTTHILQFWFVNKSSFRHTVNFEVKLKKVSIIRKFDQKAEYKSNDYIYFTQ